MESTGPEFPAATMGIPVDLFISKKHPGLTHGEVGFANASGDMVFRVNTKSPKSDKRVLLDVSGNPLFSIYQNKKGCWQGYRGDSSKRNNELLVFRVERTLKKLNKTELEVFLVGENRDDSCSDFKVKGLPFQKSCTIYRGNSIVAQSSFMYKLNQVFVERGKFRLTIFPDLVDHALVAALIDIDSGPTLEKVFQDGSHH